MTDTYFGDEAAFGEDVAFGDKAAVTREAGSPDTLQPASAPGMGRATLSPTTLPWTEERVEQLRALWVEGLSASRIAAELAGGVTRNAVIGKVHRLGLSGRAKAAAGDAAARVRPGAVKPGPGGRPLGGADGAGMAVPDEAGPSRPGVPQGGAPQSGALQSAALQSAALQSAAHLGGAFLAGGASLASMSLAGAGSAGASLIGAPVAGASIAGASWAGSSLPARSSGTAVLPLGENVTIMDLRESMCRWPVGDPSSTEFRYCGGKAPIGAGPYCAHHSRMAYQPVQDRRRRSA